MIEVLIIRHGQTAGNLARRYVGCTDEPLCPAGKAAAAASGMDEGVELVYVSPMRRAVETAEIKFPKARQITLPDLREMDFGAFEGYTADELAGDPRYAAWVESGCTTSCPGGEGIWDFQTRVCLGFRQAVNEAITSGAEKLIIVAHGGTIMAIMSRYAEPRRPYFDWAVKNCGGIRAKLDPASFHALQRLHHVREFHFPGDTHAEQ